jgi:hypothetical protein
MFESTSIATCILLFCAYRIIKYKSV